MEVLIERTRKQLLSWIEVEEMRLHDGNGLQLQQFKDRAEGCQNFTALVNLQIELWTSLGYQSKALECLRNMGRLASMGRARLGKLDAVMELLKFVRLLKIMPGFKNSGMWVLAKQLEKGLRTVGYNDAKLIAYPEYVLEWASKEGYL